MKLAALISDLPEARVIGAPNLEGIDVHAVKDDSRHVQPGDVFVAVRGRSTDGHQFLAKAVARGAVAVVVEEPLDAASVPQPVVQVVVPSTADALGVLAARRAGRPADRMTMIGITGTNGKTTTTYLLEAVLRAAGAEPGVIGTVSYRYGGKDLPAPYTTPTPLVLHGVLGDMVAAGCTHAVMEVSSAALSMDRLAGVRFAVGAWTNLTQDHLEVHGTMDAYREAKEILFRRHLAASGTAIVNLDDPAAPAMAAAAGDHPVLRVSARGHADADVRVLRADSSIAGIRAELATPRGTMEVASRALLGDYNIANLTMAVAVSEALGLDQAAVAQGIARMAGVPGRVERVANDAGLDILVDYAHTPDALANVLAALRPLTRRRLICVFGCGGDRDPSKRPRMGAAVAADGGADLAVVTSDNPRSEDPQAIIDMILPAVPDPFFVDTDRRTAIRAAVAEATPGDIVLIAGKGHEDYQILGSEKIHFDDREEAAQAAAARWDFPLKDVVAATGGTLAQGAGDDQARAVSFSRVVIDGRAAAPGDLYVAIRGERFDGHDFCDQAVAAGATGVLVETGRVPHDAREGALGGAAIIEVADTREALGALARWHRRRWGAADGGPRHLIGITGSAGKTTTKELIAAALSARYRVHATRGSLNNETGVPLTLLGLRPHHHAAVVEMGMRGLGQIDYLARMAEPTVAAVLNAGVAHVGVVGSVEAIAQGKAEIFRHLPPTGTAVYPADDARLSAHAAGAPARLTFGDQASPDADVCVATYAAAADHAELAFDVRGERHTARLALVGRHNARNAACAMACATAAGVPPREAAAALAHARPAAMRGVLAEVGGRRVLIDCYNANPASMSAALVTLAELRDARGGRAVAVLGDMLELGDTAAAAHQEAGRQAAGLSIRVIALGEHAPALAAGAGDLGTAIPSTAAAGQDHTEAAARLALQHTRPGDWILVKASRGMRLERVIEAARRLAATAAQEA